MDKKQKIFIYTDSTLSQTHISGNVQVLVLRYQDHNLGNGGTYWIS